MDEKPRLFARYLGIYAEVFHCFSLMHEGDCLQNQLVQYVLLMN